MSVPLPGTGETTALGFGCSALVGGRTRREALRLLDAAYDAGIRHFDVARAYGTGDAEGVLGEFAQRHRDELTIATKFGLQPPPQTASVNALKHLLRPAMRRSRRLLTFARRHASRAVVRPAQFTPEVARASLEASLRELRTSYVDVFLAHECTPGDWHDEALQATLQQFRADGLIRAAGPASTYRHVAAIVDAGDLAVAQFEADAINGNAVASGPLTITYGALRETLPALRARLADRDQATAWRAALGFDVAEHLPRLLLAAALDQNPGGIVLFSAADERRVAENARVAFERPYPREVVTTFRGLIGPAMFTGPR